jgi:predicted DNA-binding protein
MPISEAKRRANEKWNRENMSKKYYRPSVLLPREWKPKVERQAERKGHASTSDYIRKLIEKDLEAGK